MRLNQTTTNSLVKNRVVRQGVMVNDTDLVHRAGTSAARRFLAERAYRGPGSAMSSCQCELRQPLSLMSKLTSVTDPVLPGPVWAALVIRRAIAA